MSKADEARRNALGAQARAMISRPIESDFSDEETQPAIEVPSDLRLDGDGRYLNVDWASDRHRTLEITKANGDRVARPLAPGDKLRVVQHGSGNLTEPLTIFYSEASRGHK